jgi:hypothetical protein
MPRTAADAARQAPDSPGRHRTPPDPDSLLAASVLKVPEDEGKEEERISPRASVEVGKRGWPRPCSAGAWAERGGGGGAGGKGRIRPVGGRWRVGTGGRAKILGPTPQGGS